MNLYEPDETMGDAAREQDRFQNLQGEIGYA